MIAMKVNNEDIWKDVKAGKVKGFSIEGYFADKYEMSQEKNEREEIINKLKELLK
jgi:phage head maturation protease